MENQALPPPSLQTGWQIFVSRSLSLIAAFIMAVILCVISFFLLTFPVITGYYYAVRHSRREEYFIDMVNISRTTALLFRGIGKYFFQSYIFGIIGLLPVVVLFIAPVLPAIISPEKGLTLSLILQILWIPTFFLAGAVIFYGYPHLVATNSGIASFRYALSMGKANPLAAIGRGLLLLYPIPAALFHFLMVFSYPILVGWAVASTDDESFKVKKEVSAPGEITLKKLLLTLLLAAVMVGILYLFAGLWGGIGFFIGLGLCFTLALLFAKRITR